jgi:hypothetical protein
VRQIGRVIGHSVDVKEHRARNVTGEIFGARVAAVRWEISRAVHHHDVRLAEIVGEPFG